MFGRKIYLTLDFYTVAIHNFKSCYNTLVTTHDELMKEHEFLKYMCLHDKFTLNKTPTLVHLSIVMLFTFPATQWAHIRLAGYCLLLQRECIIHEKLPLTCSTESLHPYAYTDCLVSHSSIIKLLFPI